MDVALISSLAAWAAALVAASVAAIQFHIGRKQAEASLTSARAALMNAENSGRHTVAEFRQKWIDRVIDALSEHHSIVMTSGRMEHESDEAARKLAASRTRLEILLNPEEDDTARLMACLERLRESPLDQRDQHSAEVIGVARKLLKREWVRIKSELG